MISTKAIWKKGRGKLGALDPLLGAWETEADSPQGRVRCVRTFTRALGDRYVILEARWELPDRVYEEHALFGVGDDARLAFWSFTSDGKRSHGVLTDAGDVHPRALGFEAEMPAGRARMVYWPADAGGFHWAVESKTKKGWKRFVEHLYRPC
jgi:hypothetical protein